MSSFTDIQRAFVRQYMGDDDVIGVRVRKINDQMELFVEVSDRNAAKLPTTFRGLPVVVREGRRAMLAYS
jgi:hypothetical protein